MIDDDDLCFDCGYDGPGLSEENAQLRTEIERLRAFVAAIDTACPLWSWPVECECDRLAAVRDAREKLGATNV